MSDDNLDPQLMFVYGTFRSDDPLSPRNLPERRVIARAELPGYKLHRVGGFPGARPSDDEEDSVIGQVLDYRDLSYEEWEDRVRRFDRIEGHPRMFERQIVEIQTLDGEDSFHIWTYIYQTPMDERSLIESGDWLEFRQNRAD